MSWEGGSVPELTLSKGLAEGQGYWGGRQDTGVVSVQPAGAKTWSLCDRQKEESLVTGIQLITSALRL